MCFFFLDETSLKRREALNPQDINNNVTHHTMSSNPSSPSDVYGCVPPQRDDALHDDTSETPVAAHVIDDNDALSYPVQESLSYDAINANTDDVAADAAACNSIDLSNHELHQKSAELSMVHPIADHP